MFYVINKLNIDLSPCPLLLSPIESVQKHKGENVDKEKQMSWGRA